MEQLFEKHLQKMINTDLDFVRSLTDDINWDARLVGIKGARGVGKTTLMLQYIKKNLQQDGSVLYVSLDNIWFSDNKLSAMVETFVKRGGQRLFLDEVHKYPNWAQELKNIYDDYPQLKVVFTGSSLLEILNARADLSRRAIVYSLQGLSFREYLNMTKGTHFSQLTLDDILTNHGALSQQIVSEIKPLQYFSEYLRNGYYPFYQELPSHYFSRLEEVVNLILEIELPLLRGVNAAYINKIKQMLFIISESVPFVPNISKLSERIGVNRITFLTYLYYLQEVGIVRNVYKQALGISKLQKPDKLFLENTNLIYALAPDNNNTGNLRETFFVNQLSKSHKVTFSDESDFVINGKWTFEVGGKSKTTKQIQNVKDSFVAVDDIEYGLGQRIPLWLFGFLY